MKVLHLIDSGGLYGAEQVVLSLCETQMQQGMSPTILSCGIPGEPLKEIELVAKDRAIPINIWRMKAGLNRRGVKEILSWAEKEGFEVIHSHGYKFNILLAVTSRKRIGIPAITTVHGYVRGKLLSKMWLYESLDRLAVRRLDKVVLVSYHMLELKGFKHPSVINKTVVIHNGISIKEKNSNYRVMSKPIRNLVAVGRLSREKGFDRLVRVMPVLLRNDPNYHLTIMGEGPMRQTIERLIADLKIEKAVDLVGFVSDAKYHIKNYDALIIPSRTEGIPITLLEALSEGMVVFAASVGGIPEVLKEHQRFLLSPNFSGSLVEKIESWERLDCRSKSSFIEDLKSHVGKEFSSKVMADSYARVYESVVKTIPYRCNIGSSSD